VGEPVTFGVAEDLRSVTVDIGGAAVPHSQLPAGLSALLTWVGDLLMRLDRLPWQGDLPVVDREFVLLLDEVEVHLHPTWQRRVLPMVERLFPRVQILAATHSPFVIQSAADAWLHGLVVEGGRARLGGTWPGPHAESYTAITQQWLGVETEFSSEIEGRWRALRELKAAVLRGTEARLAFDLAARDLAAESAELHEMVAIEARQLDAQLAARSPRA
jgi:hypothetical protein